MSPLSSSVELAYQRQLRAMFPVEAFQATLSKWMAMLRQHGIRFHLTGGLTSAEYGEPRMTQVLEHPFPRGNRVATGAVAFADRVVARRRAQAMRDVAGVTQGAGQMASDRVVGVVTLVANRAQTYRIQNWPSRGRNRWRAFISAVFEFCTPEPWTEP